MFSCIVSTYLCVCVCVTGAPAAITAQLRAKHLLTTPALTDKQLELTQQGGETDVVMDIPGKCIVCVYSVCTVCVELLARNMLATHNYSYELVLFVVTKFQPCMHRVTQNSYWELRGQTR